MKDFFEKDNYSIFNKFVGTFEKAIEIVDKMDKEEEIDDSLGFLMGNIFIEEGNFDLNKMIISLLLFIAIACSLILFYALLGFIVLSIF